MADSRPVSSFLFCKEDGDAIRFFIRPSTTKARLKPLIEERGGIVSSKLHGCQDWIKLAADGDKVSSDDYFTTAYIEDCIATNQLLPMDTFRVPQQQQPGPASPSDSVMSNVSVKGRSRYDSGEDGAILVYIAKHPECSYSGNQVWKKMELLKVTEHPWQSMKHRFLKKLVDDLPEYIELWEKRAEKPTSSTRIESFSEEDDVGALSTALKETETFQTNPGEEQGQPMNVHENGNRSNSELSPKTGGKEQNHPIEIQNISNGSDSDFDNHLIEAAEYQTPTKTRSSSQDSAEAEDMNTDEERPHGTRELHTRSPKVTSNGIQRTVVHSGPAGGHGIDVAEDTSNEERDSVIHSSQRKRKRLSLDSDSEELVIAVLTDSDSQAMGALPEDEQDYEESVTEVVTFVKGAMNEYSVSAKTVVHLLYLHSGGFDSVLDTLQIGRIEDLPMWTKVDDDKLNSSNPKDITDLCKKYGQDVVMKRQAFFN